MPTDWHSYPEEPLALSAPLARELAPRLCHDDPQRGSCAWYHGFWQYLRLLDFVTTPRDHADFYREALQTPIADGARRVLVSGTADYALPACVLWIFGRSEVGPDLTVLDLCPTPLRLSEWYAGHVGVRLRTVGSDILKFRPPERFDVVTTHAFLGRFAPDRRPELFAHWHDLLHPGGRVATVNRVRSGAFDTVKFTPEQADRFIARVRDATHRRTITLDVSEDELLAMARDYIAAKRTYPVSSADEIVGLFECAGFRIERLDVGPVGPRALQAPAGPTMSGGADYARVVARRR